MQGFSVLSCCFYYILLYFESNRNKFCFCVSGSHDIVHVKDATGNMFATRLSNIFIIGRDTKAMVSLPRGKGIRLTISEERDRRLAEKAKSA